jgi:hypothetical protein
MIHFQGDHDNFRFDVPREVRIGSTVFLGASDVSFHIERRNGKKGTTFRIKAWYHSNHNGDRARLLTKLDANGEFAGTYKTHDALKRQIERCYQLLLLGGEEQGSSQTIVEFINELRQREKNVPRDAKGHPLQRQKGNIRIQRESLEILTTLGLPGKIRDLPIEQFEAFRQSLDWNYVNDNGAEMIRHLMRAAVERIPSRTIIRKWLQDTAGAPDRAAFRWQAWQVVTAVFEAWWQERHEAMTEEALRAGLPDLIDALCRRLDGVKIRRYGAAHDAGDWAWIDIGPLFREWIEDEGPDVILGRRMVLVSAQTRIKEFKRIARQQAGRNHVFGGANGSPRTPLWATSKDPELSPSFDKRDIEDDSLRENPVTWEEVIAILQNQNLLSPRDQLAVEFVLNQGERITQLFLLRKDEINYDDLSHHLIHNPMSSNERTKAGAGQHVNRKIKCFASERFYRITRAYLEAHARDPKDPLVTEIDDFSADNKAQEFRNRFRRHAFKVCGREITPHMLRKFFCNLVDRLVLLLETDKEAKDRARRIASELGAHNYETFNQNYKNKLTDEKTQRDYVQRVGELYDLIDGVGPRPSWLPDDWLPEFRGKS